ncbi:MAG: alanine racemase [Nocardioidaceae bacterium]
MRARALARVDLGAIERNCRLLRSRLRRGAEVCAVVKADGYGHGAVWAAKAALEGGASWLAVATADEAADLRRHGIAGRILVMGALTFEETRTAIEADADLVAWSDGFVAYVAEHAVRGARPPRLHVKLDTGMGRLGTKDPHEAHAVADAVAADARLELAGVMTHFATADQEGDDHFAAQLARFAAFAGELKGRHPNVVAHAANSAAVFRDPASHFDMARCGIAIYGLDPFGRDPAKRGLEPALALESWLAAVKRFEPGESAGYGRTWRADAPTWVGVVPIGYGDGWRRGLSNRAELLVGGRRRPLVGTISMDNVTVDLGPEPEARVGDPVVLIGAQGSERILCEEVAGRLGTINYEITCGLSPRVRRRHAR